MRFAAACIDKFHGGSVKRNRKNREHAMKTQKEGSDIAYTFFNLKAKLKCVVNATLLPLYHPVSFIQLCLTAGQDGYGKCLHPGIRSPDRPAHNESLYLRNYSRTFVVYGDKVIATFSKDCFGPTQVPMLRGERAFSGGKHRPRGTEMCF